VNKINCYKCPHPAHCCQEGVSIDLEEAKKIIPLKLGGEFFHLEKDKDFPSGYRIDTSLGDQRCTFLTKDGLCSVHNISYDLKPTPCKEFPWDEDGGLSTDVESLCIVHIQRKRKNTK